MRPVERGIDFDCIESRRVTGQMAAIGTEPARMPGHDRPAGAADADPSSWCSRSHGRWRSRTGSHRSHRAREGAVRRTTTVDCAGCGHYPRLVRNDGRGAAMFGSERRGSEKDSAARLRALLNEDQLMTLVELEQFG